MSRFDRRAESVERLADAVNDYRKSIADVPPWGTPREVSSNTVARADEILIVETGSVDVNITLPSRIEQGHGVTILNSAAGSAKVVCPSGFTFMNGQETFTITTKDVPNIFIAVTRNRYMYLLSDGTVNSASLSEAFPQFYRDASDVSLIKTKAWSSESPQYIQVIINDVAYTSETFPTCDLDATGLGGADAATTLSTTAMAYLYYVPDGGGVALVASVNDPDTGPESYSEYRYAFAVAITAIPSSASILKFQHNKNGDVFYTQKYDNTPLRAMSIGAIANSGGTTFDTWHLAEAGYGYGAGTVPAVPQNAAKAMYIATWHDLDSDDLSIAFSGDVGGAAPSYTPLQAFGVTIEAQTGAGDTDDRAWDGMKIHTDTGQLWFYIVSAATTASPGFRVYIDGYWDQRSLPGY